MFTQIHKSSRGNPWHDPNTGRFTFGPMGRNVSVSGYESGSVVEAEDGRKILYMEKSKEEYDETSVDRFSQPVDPNTYEQTRSICKSLGLDVTQQRQLFGVMRNADGQMMRDKDGDPIPITDSNGNPRITEYECRIFNERFQYDTFAPSEKQAQKIRHLEEETGIPYSSTGKYGGHAGAYIGMAENYIGMKDEKKWTKSVGADGVIEERYKSVGVIRKGKRGFDSIRVDHKIRNGHRTYKENLVDPGAANTKHARESIAEYERSNYEQRYKQGMSRKRAKSRVEERMSFHDGMRNPDRWTPEGDTLVYTSPLSSIERNGEYGKYVVKKTDQGWECERHITVLQKVRDTYIEHERTESVCTKCKSPNVAIREAIEHDRKSVLREINLNAASSKEVVRWGGSEYTHMLDELNK